MKDKSWSISRRLSLWFGLTTTLLVVTISGVSSLVVRAAVEARLSGLVDEELEEMHALFSVTDGTPAAFVEIVEELADEHPANRMAWRVWSKETGELWGEFGKLNLFKHADPELVESEQVFTFDTSFRWKAQELTSELSVGLVLDGSEQLHLIQFFDLAALSFVGFSVLLATLAGTILGRKTSDLLRRVAESVRTVHAPGDELPLETQGAPEEIREVAQALNEMLDNIRVQSEKANLVTSGLAHELRSPIQNLLGETEVALMRDHSADDYRQILESRLEELRDLAQAVDNLVTLCAGVSGGSRGAEHFDIGHEARLRLARETVLARKAEMDLEIQLKGALDFEGDREAVMLVLHNLVTNAIKWSDRGGRVDVLLAGKNGQVEFVVDDAGPGIPPDEREKIFEPFYRGSTRQGTRAGYGLGLALTRTAVQAHSGSIEVSTSPLGGARFRVLLPRAGDTDSSVSRRRKRA